jgi:hypothetical protein
MKPIHRFLIMLALVLAVTALLGTGGPTPEAGASPQEAAETQQSTSEEPLPDFQPSERLPADAAVAFPTDI